MRLKVLATILCTFFLSAYASTYVHASNSLDIQRYEHQGCVLSESEHYPPEHAQVGLKEKYWYGVEPEEIDFEYENCREVVRQAQDYCDSAVEYMGYLPSEDRDECNAQYRAEIPICRAHYSSQYEVCETIKSTARLEPKQSTAEKMESFWEELLPSDTLAPGWEELVPDEPNDYAGLDRELYRLESELDGRGDEQDNLDDAFGRLALRMQELQRQELERDRREETERERERRRLETEEEIRKLEQEAQRLIEEYNRRQEQERMARVQREQMAREERERESGEGLANFLQMIGTGVQLYNMFDTYDQDPVPHESYSRDSSPSYSRDESGSRWMPRPCTLADGSPGYMDGQGRCLFDDTARAR